MNVGDRVRINHHANPRYLHGIHGVVVELDQHTATVCVHRPDGRFKSGEIPARHWSLTDSAQPRDKRKPMTPAAAPDLDNLIDDITVDCYDEDEQSA